MRMCTVFTGCVCVGGGGLRVRADVWDCSWVCVCVCAEVWECKCSMCVCVCVCECVCVCVHDGGVGDLVLGDKMYYEWVGGE